MASSMARPRPDRTGLQAFYSPAGKRAIGKRATPMVRVDVTPGYMVERARDGTPYAYSQ